MLEENNAVLAKEADAGKKNSIAKQMEDAKWKADYRNLKRFVDSIPEDIMRQLRQPKRTQNQER